MSIDPVGLIFLGAAVGLLPLVFMMTSSYVKVVVVLLLVRNALGVQQIPPQMVINGLALILTIFIMAPVASDTMTLIEKEAANATAEVTPLSLIEAPDRV